MDLPISAKIISILALGVGAATFLLLHYGVPPSPGPPPGPGPGPIPIAKKVVGSQIVQMPGDSPDSFLRAEKDRFVAASEAYLIALNFKTTSVDEWVAVSMNAPTELSLDMYRKPFVAMFVRPDRIVFVHDTYASLTATGIKTNDDGWHKVDVAHDTPTTWKLYVDGALKDSMTVIPGTIVRRVDGAELYIAGRPEGSAYIPHAKNLTGCVRFIVLNHYPQMPFTTTADIRIGCKKAPTP